MKAKNFDVVKQAQAVAREQIKKQMQPLYDLYEAGECMPKDTKKKLYLVDTIVTFRHKYVVEANELEHAYDEVTMRDSGADEDNFDEVTQLYLGETITDGREISKKEFKKMLKALEANKREVSSYWMGDRLIRKIDYDRD